MAGSLVHHISEITWYSNVLVWRSKKKYASKFSLRTAIAILCAVQMNRTSAHSPPIWTSKCSVRAKIMRVITRAYSNLLLNQIYFWIGARYFRAHNFRLNGTFWRSDWRRVCACSVHLNSTQYSDQQNSKLCCSKRKLWRIFFFWTSN